MRSVCDVIRSLSLLSIHCSFHFGSFYALTILEQFFSLPSSSLFFSSKLNKIGTYPYMWNAVLCVHFKFQFTQVVCYCWPDALDLQRISVTNVGARVRYFGDAWYMIVAMQIICNFRAFKNVFWFIYPMFCIPFKQYIC